MQEKRPFFVRFSRMLLENRTASFTRKDAAADSTLRTLSRIDRAFINVPTAEARDFHCYSHVSDNLGERSIPSDHVAVRIVVQKPTGRRDEVQRIPSWMSKQHPVFCTILKRISDAHQYPDEPFDALADFEVIIEKARKQGSLDLFLQFFPFPSQSGPFH